MSKYCKKCGKKTQYPQYDLCKDCYEKEMFGTGDEYDELPTEGFKKCILCGESSNGYAFCKDCWQEYDDSELLDMLNNPELLKKEKERLNDEFWDELLEDEDEDEPQEDQDICLLCGKTVSGHLVCKDCYNKYKNKEILVKINKMTIPFGEPLDVSYEGVYQADDGHIVKSQAERDIDNYLFENNILHGYETPLDVGEEKPLRPDFYLKNYLGQGKDVYIEYFGITDNKNYDQIIAYKMPLYEKAKITLICMYAKTDLKNLRFALQTKLNKNRIIENKINYLEK